MQFGESFFDWTDTSARTVEMHSVTLGLLRSARIEAPFLTIGFVGGDLASWVQEPHPHHIRRRSAYILYMYNESTYIDIYNISYIYIYIIHIHPCINIRCRGPAAAHREHF